jgi:signal transduction histidine kinase
VWVYTLLLPSLAESGWLPAGFLRDGPFGIALLRPQALFGLDGLDPISHAMLWSMFANVGAYVGVSVAGRPRAAERRQATLFVDEGAGTGLWRGSASIEDLRALLERFLGPVGASEALLAHARERGLAHPPPVADADLEHHAETLLAGAVGAASARIMIASVAGEEPVGLGEVMEILDEASQIRAYSRGLERKSRELEAATAELRAANARLTELDRRKDDFVSTVTHELRTPLTSIRTFAEILLDSPDLTVDERERYLRIVAEEAERLSRLINQVLDLSKLESGRVEWRITAVDLASVVRDSVTGTGQLFAEAGARLEVDLPDELPRVAADRDRVIQVMLNLLSNAAKFCDPEAGRVTVGLHLVDSAVQVDVRDNGGGVAAVDQQAVFEKFRQGSEALLRRPHGTGLGLPISRQIIDHLGGKLWVRSAPGHGATFSFTLPLAPGAPAADLPAGVDVPSGVEEED